MSVLELILVALQAILSAATSLGLATVKINPLQPSDKESVLFPFTGIFYSPEGWESRGRCELNSGILTIETYFKLETAKENQYLFLLNKEALIHSVLFDACKNGALKGYIQNIEKNMPEYLLIDDTLLSIVQEYKITFLHMFGNPFTVTY